MIKRFFYAAGLATFLMASNLVQAFYPDHGPVYHSPLAGPTFFFAILGDYAVIILLSVALYELLQRIAPVLASPQVLMAVWPGLAVLLNRTLATTLWHKALDKLGLAHGSANMISDMRKPVTLGTVALLWAGWVLLVLLAAKSTHKGRKICLVAVRISFLAGALLGADLMVNVVRGGIRHWNDSKVAPLQPTTPEQRAKRPRVVWVVMDELAYAPVFEHRVSDLSMPNFDRLRGESIVFTDTRPVADWTDLALPSLLSGRTWTNVEYSYSDKLSFVDKADNKMYPFDPRQTVMGEAESAGWNVALVGWWHPYCTIFSGMLQRCIYDSRDRYTPMSAHFSVWQNMKRSLTSRLRNWQSIPFLWARNAENIELINSGLDDISDDDMDLVFIHIGVPHFPYIYDRHTGKLDRTREHSYQDGLAYADVVLGQFMTALEKTPRWQNTTFVVNGDHSWRIWMWSREEGWTQEDADSSGGQWDDRPLMLIHQAGQTSPEVVTQPTSLLRSHDVVESVIRSSEH